MDLPLIQEDFKAVLIPGTQILQANKRPPLEIEALIIEEVVQDVAVEEVEEVAPLEKTLLTMPEIGVMISHRRMIGITRSTLDLLKIRKSSLLPKLVEEARNRKRHRTNSHNNRFVEKKFKISSKL